MISVGAEAGMLFTLQACRIDDFFLPLPVNKPPDFSGAIMGGCYKVSIRRG